MSSAKRTSNNLRRAHRNPFEQSKHRNGASKEPKELPVSPRKKTEVISRLVKRYGIQLKLAETRERERMGLSDKEKEWFLNFSDRPDITYINPGRKDNV